MDPCHQGRDRLGRADVTDAPTGHGIGFGEAVEQDRTFARARQRSQTGMLSDIGQPVVDLVGEKIEVVPVGERDQALQVGSGLRRAGRIGG